MTHVVQYNIVSTTMQCNTVQYSAMQYNIYNAIWYSAMQYNIMQDNIYNAVQYSAM